MNHPVIKVTQKGDTNVCAPTESGVKAGDTLEWEGDEPFLVFFPGDTSPFVEGRGPFINGERVTVKTPLPAGAPWKPQFQVAGKFSKKATGDIKPAGK